MSAIVTGVLDDGPDHIYISDYIVLGVVVGAACFGCAMLVQRCCRRQLSGPLSKSDSAKVSSSDHDTIEMDSAPNTPKESSNPASPMHRNTEASLDSSSPDGEGSREGSPLRPPRSSGRSGGRFASQQVEYDPEEYSLSVIALASAAAQARKRQLVSSLARDVP